MQTTPASGTEALEGSPESDAACFKSFYSLHKTQVYSFCLRLTGNSGEAEDLAQDAFVQFYRSAALARADSATWLYRMTAELVITHLRKRGLTEVSFDESLEAADEGDSLSGYGREDKVLRGATDRITLERAIESLPCGYRSILVLHDVEGYEHHEISEMMDCSVGNSKSQLHKARKKLRGLLKITRGRI